MNKQLLLKTIPFVLIIISVVAVVWTTQVLQNVENQCNTHLKNQYDRFKDDACDICGSTDPLTPTANATIDLPDWVTT